MLFRSRQAAERYGIKVNRSERHTFDLASHEVGEVGKKERFRRNMEAIRVLKECEFENRFATPDEQIILSKYVGWGGLPEAFDENNTSWADEYKELYTALSPEEYATASESVLTAFYTPPTIIIKVKGTVASRVFFHFNAEAVRMRKNGLTFFSLD